MSSQEGEALHLAQDDEAGLMGGQGQHDEVGVQAVEAVAQVGLPGGTPPLLPDVLHDLVLPLPGHVCIRQHHLWGVSMRAVIEGEGRR